MPYIPGISPETKKGISESNIHWASIERMELPMHGINSNRPRYLSDKISEILHSEFQNPLVPFNKNTLENLRISEVVSLYSFLTFSIISFKTGRDRPKYKATKSLAKNKYKQAMVDYIHCFGYRLRGKPSDYRSAFLEALANYCEVASGNEGN